jgi:hypothetical protein
VRIPLGNLSLIQILFKSLGNKWRPPWYQYWKITLISYLTFRKKVHSNMQKNVQLACYCHCRPPKGATKKAVETKHYSYGIYSVCSLNRAEWSYNVQVGSCISIISLQPQVFLKTSSSTNWTAVTFWNKIIRNYEQYKPTKKKYNINELENKCRNDLMCIWIKRGK